MTETVVDLREDLVVLTHSTGESTLRDETADAVNAVRFLAADAVERAGSGHPGTAMALAPLAYRLYTRYLRHDPADPDWFDRDRVVLSIGHASMLLYASLHLAGYRLTLEDLRRFRQLGSRTPGHPERGETPGIDISTGPLGQGVANGVGFALAERMLAARYNDPDGNLSPIDHRTWVIAGDGDMMEGISSEAASFAGRLGLDKLTVFYDSNRISLEGAAEVEMCEDVAARFTAYDWQVLTVGCVNDLDGLDRAVTAARSNSERPTLVVVGSNIGYGSPKQDSAAAHGSPLGTDALEAARDTLDWPYAPFEVPDAVYRHWAEGVATCATARTAWHETLRAYRERQPARAAELERTIAGQLPPGWLDALPSWTGGTSVSGRDASGVTLNALASVLPELVGGSADLAPSTKTTITSSGDVNAGDWAGANIHFGVREHAMGAICNALAAHGGLRPFCATFFVFSDYLRPAVRMSALMRLPVVWVMTHDSISVGEDGPTHQPIEHLASFRAMPGIRVIRPADANETARAWAAAIGHDGPTMLVLSRQALPVLEPASVDDATGAAIVADGDDAVLVGTGSEVALADAARELLAAEGIACRVVSLPSWEVFREQPVERRRAVLPPQRPTVAVEAGASQGWCEFADAVVGIDQFGASGPSTEVATRVGLTAEATADRLRSLIESGFRSTART
jgi:transketolase